MKEVILLFTLMLIVSFANATPIIPVIDITYDFNKTAYSDNNIYPYSSVLLRVNTASFETSCYYTSIASATPLSTFEKNYGTIHEQTIKNLENGIHKYYVQCENSSSPILNVTLKINPPIYGTISLSKDSPLKIGTYELTLTTSKPAIEIPKLEYSFDGISYLPVVLEGSETKWKGYLIIEEDLEDAVGSFKFEAKDSSGTKGTELRGDSIFLVDTIRPKTVVSIEATGYTGQIRLNWFYEEEVEEFNIYKAEDPNIGYINLYESTDDEDFTDNDVEKGKTYYYRVAAVDEAGNLGELSREISATVLFSNTNKSTGLRIELLGNVENFLSELSFTIKSIDEIKSLLSSKEQKEKDLFSLLNLDKELENSKTEINTLKRDVELYKSQDLTKEGLENKLNSASLKLNIIKKNIPEKIIILDETQSDEVINEEKIQEAILVYNPLIEEKEYQKSISLTREMIKEMNLKISTTAYSIKVSYFDGTNKQFTIVEHDIPSLLEKTEDTFLLLKIPTTIVEKTSELNIKNINYEKVEENAIAFYSDTKKISYYLEKDINLNNIEEITLTPIKIKKPEVGKSSITGNIISGVFEESSYGAIIILIFFILLGIYLVYSRRNKDSEKICPILEKIESIKEVRKENSEEIHLMYDSLKKDYKELNKRQKKLVLDKINELKKIKNWE